MSAERPRVVTLAAVATVVLGVAAALAIALVPSGGGGSSAVSPQQPDRSGAGHGAHDGHGGAVAPGCEAVGGVMMMLSPSSADELLGGTCPWPYDPSIEVAGGTEDPALGPPFEARRYQELFDVVAASGAGVCSVGTLPDEAGDGFVFGFTIELRGGSCADGPPTGSLVAREQVSRAWRDANAHAAAPDGDHTTLVLGRWVLLVAGQDPAERASLVDGLAGIGAVVVS